MACIRSSQSNAERLMRTELARVQIGAQQQAISDAGYDEYMFLALGTACENCRVLDGKTFKLKKMIPGDNAPPMHPFCRCSVAAAMFDEEFKELTGVDLVHLDLDAINAAAVAKYKNKDTGGRKETLSQNYKKVVVNNEVSINITEKEGKITANRISTMPDNFYLSQKAHIKPKSLREIEKEYNTAIKKIGKDQYSSPTIVIVAYTELGSFTAGRYKSESNTLYIKPQKDTDGQRHTIIHELYHWRDLQEYIVDGKAVTDQNEYIKQQCKKDKKIIDKLGINSYNVSEISDYAASMYFKRRYDETYTEYRTKLFEVKK